VKNANAVNETGVRCSGIDEIRETLLFYSPEPLKRTRLYHVPQRILEFLCTKFDKVVDRVSDALGLKYHLRILFGEVSSTQLWQCSCHSSGAH